MDLVSTHDVIFGCREEEISKFIESQEREMDDYVEEREKIIKAHEEEFNAMKNRQWEEEVALEAMLNAKLKGLMAKYSPLHPNDTSDNGNV